MASKYAMPIVNLNGSSGVDLMKGHSEVIKACNHLLYCLGYASPHARDYQTAATGTFNEAVSESRADVLAVEGVRKHHEAILENLVAQIEEREKK